MTSHPNHPNQIRVLRRPLEFEEPVGLRNLGRAVSAGFGMIIRVLFSALYAALRVLLALTPIFAVR
jgi:hypothetical protein